MSHRDYLPQAIKVFRAWVKNFFTVLAGIYASLGIDKEAYDALENEKRIWDNIDAKAGDALTATIVVIHERRRVMKDFSKKIRSFVSEYVAHNHRLTPIQREELGLAPVGSHSSKSMLLHAPLVEIIIKNVPGQITVHCRSAETKWGMGIGIRGFEWRWVISDTPPETYDEFIHSEFSTRAHYTKTFDYNRRGKKLHSVFRWENDKGEKGPWSDFFVTFIP
jgi:hypothetical protein